VLLAEAINSRMVGYTEVIQDGHPCGSVPGSLSVVSEARVSKLDTRARCVCALSIQRLEGGRWRLWRMRTKGADLTAMGIQSFRSSVSCWFCGT